MRDDVYVVGDAWLDAEDVTELQLDEAVFEACSAALKKAGLKRHQLGLSVISSLDLYDARSISSALTAPAAAGYLNDELRVEGDATAALLVAAATLVSGQCEFAIVVASSMPEVGSTEEHDLRRLREHISSYTFDSHMDRPVGLTAATCLGLHAQHQVQTGATTLARLAEATAGDLTRGAARRGGRSATDAEGVRTATMVADPLTSLMLPAETAGVGALVLGVGRPALRTRRARARLAGWGTATGPATSNPRWLTHPAEPAATAAAAAYGRAGLADTSLVTGAELMDLSPALTDDLLEALKLEHLSSERVNTRGGVRSHHPGLASGMMRMRDAMDSLDDIDGGLHVVHAADDLMGLVSQTTTVLVLEAP